MVSVDFSRPLYLWLLLILPFLIGAHFFFLKHAQNKAMRFANFEAIKRIAGERFLVKNSLVLILRVLAILVLIFSLAGTTLWYEGPKNDFDYVLAIDTSPSMLTKDVQPSRLEAAKDAALFFLNSLKTNSKVGLVTFSGVTYVRSSLVEDYLDLRVEISLLNTSRTSGTDVSGAIITSTNLFEENDRGRAVILFTDGIDTAGAYIDDAVREAVNYAVSKKVIVHVVGLGTDSAPVGYLPELYNLSSTIDRDTIFFITNTSSGTALYPTSSTELVDDFQQLNNQFQIANVPIRVQEYGLLLVLLLLLIEWIVVNLRFRRVA